MSEGRFGNIEFRNPTPGVEMRITRWEDGSTETNVLYSGTPSEDPISDVQDIALLSILQCMSDAGADMLDPKHLDAFDAFQTEFENRLEPVKERLFPNTGRTP